MSVPFKTSMGSRSSPRETHYPNHRQNMRRKTIDKRGQRYYLFIMKTLFCFWLFSIKIFILSEGTGRPLSHDGTSGRPKSHPSLLTLEAFVKGSGPAPGPPVGALFLPVPPRHEQNGRVGSPQFLWAKPGSFSVRPSSILTRLCGRDRVSKATRCLPTSGVKVRHVCVSSVRVRTESGNR